MKMLLAFLCVLFTISSAQTGVAVTYGSKTITELDACRCISFQEAVDMTSNELGTYKYDNATLYAYGQATQANGANGAIFNGNKNTLETYVGLGESTEQQALVAKGYGEYCRHWEQTSFTPYGDCDTNLKLHDQCGDHNFCYAPWCYVTAACSQQTAIGYGSTDAWKTTAGSLLYSYEICGNSEGCFADDGADGCPYDPYGELGCDAIPDDRCLCEGDSGNLKIGYDLQKTLDQGRHVCTACADNQNVLGTVSFGAAGNLPQQCRVCNSSPSTVCQLPIVDPKVRLGAPTRYLYQSSKATINGLCISSDCFGEFFTSNDPGTDYAAEKEQLSDVVCAAGYDTYEGELKEITVTAESCNGATPSATLNGCIVEAPETSIYNDNGVNRHLCKQGDAHCRQRHGYCKAFTPSNTPLPWASNTAAIITKMDGFCYPCPPRAPGNGDPNNLCGSDATCVKECFGTDAADGPFFDRLSCPNGNSDCENGEFCYSGFCQLCSLVVPKGDATKCSKHLSDPTNLANCQANCPKEYESFPEPPTFPSDYIRFSRMELLRADNGERYGGFCTGLEGNVWKEDLCEHGTTNTNSAAYPYSAELDPQCARRYCTDGRGVSTAQVQFDPNHDTYVPSYCMVETKNTNEACVYSHTAQINGISTQLNLAGRCVNGECLPREDAEWSCPDGWIPARDNAGFVIFHTPDGGVGCIESFEGEFLRQPLNKNRCGKNDGTQGQFSCEALPRANKASATMYSHRNDNWPVTPATNPPSTTSISTVWGYTVDLIDEYFWFMMFTEEPVTPSVNDEPNDTLVDIDITVGTNDEINYRGRALICDPDMTDIYKEDYGCIIKAYGQYYYQGSNITFYGFSNETTKIRHYEAEPNIVTAMPMMLCGSVATRNCFGGVEFTYEKSNTIGEFCSERYATCIEPPPATSHGDPIIWTFHNECYDLNKDGLYGATVNPKFSHDVKIGVYNDFMRELVVVDRKDNIILSINSLGEHEIDDKFPYAFSYEEKPCPEEMKQTECQGTYKEWVFDAQEFRYTVHLLRHDYKDAAIPEGDLGYHLDIYPKPYKGLFEPGHLESYSGLFFENPLPEELEYCPGGSARNQGNRQ